ncbi:MAG: hypothetical protein LBJ94_03080 [Puniceicoccales bacterium]|jgi:hypothetical protein|nr:hypothetical protein [Puniceicoccales bacterium]
MKNGKNRRENLLVNVGFNIIIPAIVMMMFDDWFGISPALALILALMFPLGYGGFALFKDRKGNFFSIVGFFSVLITGGIGLLQLPREWVATKEASVPVIFFMFVIISSFGRRTFLEKLLFDENILNSGVVYAHLQTSDQRAKFHKIMLRASIILALSFLLSAVLNFWLAETVVCSESGTLEFTKELGRMVALSYPVIVLPCTLVLCYMLHYIVKKLECLTGLSADEILHLK